MTKHTSWYEDKHFVGNLPMCYRLFARYSAHTADRTTGQIPLGYPLFRCIGLARKCFRLSTEAIVPIGDVTIVIDLSDLRAQLVYLELSDLLSETGILRHLLKPGDTFVDIGANHGSYSLVAAQLVGPKGRVVAFEPQPRLVRNLVRSLAANGLQNCRVIACGLSNEQRRANLYVPDRNSGSASIFPRYLRRAVHTVVEIQMERLDALASYFSGSERIVVKLDIEGSERECLLGAERFFRRHQPDLIMEINHEAAEAGGYTVSDLIALLRSYGYTRFAELETFIRTGATTAVPDLARPRNILVMRRGDLDHAP